MAATSTKGHSSQVNITLHLGTQRLAVAELGPDFLILEEAAAPHPPCDGVINLEVDGEDDIFPVRLPSGISSKSDWVSIEEIVLEIA